MSQDKSKSGFPDGKQPSPSGGEKTIQPDENAAEALWNERISSAVLDTVGALVVVLDRQGRITQFNRACQELTGYTTAEVEGRIFWEFLVPSEDMEGVSETFEALNAGQFPNKHENHWLTKDGTRRFIAWTNTALTNALGEVHYLIATGIDITERKNIEEALRKSEAEARAREAELAAVLETVPAITFVAHDPECRRMTSSRVTRELLRLSEGANTSKSAPEAERPTSFRVMKDGRELAPHEMPVQIAAATGCEVHKFELTFALENGSSLDVLGDTAPLFDEKGQVRGAVGAFLDITERKRAEEKLRESEHKYRSIFENSLDAIFLSIPDVRVMAANPAACEIFGMTEEELCRAGRNGIEDPTDPRHAAAVTERARTGKVKYEATHVRKDGSKFPSEVSSVILDGGSRAFVILRDITERKRTDEALRLKEAELREAQRLTRIGSWHWDAQNDVTIGSDELLRIYGFDPATQRMPDFKEQRGRCYPVEEWERLNAAVQETLRTGIGYELDVEALRSGTPIWVTTRSEVVRNTEGQIVGLRGTVQDITERKLTEEALLNSRNQFQVLTQNLNCGVALVDEHGKFSIVNPAFLRMFDLPDESGINNVNDRNWGEWQVFDEYGKLLDVDEHPVRKAAMTGKAIRNMLVAVRPPAGRDLKWMIISSEPILKSDGRIDALICSYYDITERKQAEEALRASKNEAEKYAAEMAALMDAVPAAIFIAHDIECRQMSGNHVTQEMLGLPATANFSKSAPPPERPTHFRAMKDGREIPANQLPVQSAARGQDVRDYEFDLVFADGTVRTLFGDAVPLRDKTGEPRGAIGAFIEITERRRAEESLRNSERMYRAIGESIDYGIWICAPDGKNIYASESFLKLVGLTQQQCSDFGWGDILHPEDAERTMAAWKECVRTGGKWDMEHRCKGVDGQWHAILARGVPVRDDKGEITCWAGINLDISHLKKVEQALRDADRR